MSGVGVDRSTGQRLGLGARMVATLLAVAPINLLFSGLIVGVGAYTIGFAVTQTGGAEAIGEVLGAVLSLLGLSGPWLPAWVPLVPVLVGAAVTLVVVLAFVVPVKLGPKLLLVDVNASTTAPGAEPRLADTLERVARIAGVPTPRLALVESPVPQSFAAGRRGNGTVVVTRGLLATLDEDELEAVLAHEVSHLRNRDAAVICYAAFYPLLALHFQDNDFEIGEADADADADDPAPPARDADGETGTGSGTGTDPDPEPRSGTGKGTETEPETGSGTEPGTEPEPETGTGTEPEPETDPADPPVNEAWLVLAAIPLTAALIWVGAMTMSVLTGAILILVVTAVVWYPLGVLGKKVGASLAAFLSRSREFAADRGAVAITGDPAALASALETLRSTPVPDADLRAVEAIEPLGVVPMDDLEPGEPDERDRFRTHPPTAERIARLRAMARRQERG